MKKKSKVIGKDYEKLDLNNACNQFDFYGLILKDDRVKVDTKRYKKFFTLPNNKIEIRQILPICIAFDHRALDFGEIAPFMKRPVK